MPGERTEQATQHRREEAQKEGDLLHSRELSAAAGSLAGVMKLGKVGISAIAAWRVGSTAFLELGSPAHWEPAMDGEERCELIELRYESCGCAGPDSNERAAVDERDVERCACTFPGPGPGGIRRKCALV